VLRVRPICNLLSPTQSEIITTSLDAQDTNRTTWGTQSASNPWHHDPCLTDVAMRCMYVCHTRTLTHASARLTCPPVRVLEAYSAAWGFGRVIKISKRWLRLIFHDHVTYAIAYHIHMYKQVDDADQQPCRDWVSSFTSRRRALLAFCWEKVVVDILFAVLIRVPLELECFRQGALPSYLISSGLWNSKVRHSRVCQPLVVL
jgi:hypothetical protein